MMTSREILKKKIETQNGTIRARRTSNRDPEWNQA
jgi:hypothetical protein